ncbi:MAG TPA: hypothetical protein EYP85_01855 [Armatimonadetes bacterium]|nr:hypothetical protein [Armatimonadota bacterium]
MACALWNQRGEAVVIDLSSSFRSAVGEALPWCAVVVDKFHVVARVIKASLARFCSVLSIQNLTKNPQKPLPKIPQFT